MSSDLYVSLSGMMAMENRLASIAENVANMRTAGYKAEVVNFDTVLSSSSKDQVSFATAGQAYVDRSAGPLEPTGNALDLAISGEGFFAIETAGGRAYTRDGRFTINAAGDLLTLGGHAVLDDGGAGIAIDPAAGDVAIGLDGTLTQDGNDVGVIGLFAVPDRANLIRIGDSAFRYDGELEPVVDRVRNTLRQGYREGSNVNPIGALHDLIVAQRTFEHAMNATSDREDAIGRAVSELGAER